MLQIDRSRISEIIKGEIRERVEGWQASFIFIDPEGKERVCEFNLRRKANGGRESGKTLALNDLKEYLPPWMMIRRVTLPREQEPMLSMAAE